jgi:hypothetical protein
VSVVLLAWLQRKDFTTKTRRTPRIIFPLFGAKRHSTFDSALRAQLTRSCESHLLLGVLRALVVNLSSLLSRQQLGEDNVIGSPRTNRENIGEARCALV